MSMFASTFRWLQRKRYQYEVTFSLYMLTPTEKFIFNSVIFIIFSMVVIAACLYLPHHISFITNRAWFYYHGEDPTAKIAPGQPTGPTTTAAMVEKVVAETARAVMGILETEGSRFAEGRDATREL